MAITPLPTPPSRDDPTNFATRADAFLGALPDFATEANDLADDVNDDAVAAAASASTATTAAGTATTQAGIATTQAGIATTKASEALVSANSAAASFDSFDDRYLGAKTSDPTLDNDGNALLVGALYFNSSVSEMRAWNGTAWAAAYLPAGDYATLTGTETLTNKTIAFADNTLTNVASINTDQTITGTKTFSGTSSTLAMVLNDAAEVATVSATAATGTIAYDITTQSVLYYTSDASANWTVNFRASSGTSLDTALATGQSVTVAFLVTQGATAFFNNAVQVDGTTSGVTTRWLGGAPTAGNASGIDSYRYLIIKTGSATYTVLASVTQFKA
jgi:hypothetical protein